ncbi:MAG: helix-turn-helix transcriptional regulator [Chloroflexi bacterium]|nr:helix-turn-helix transcriptional regulator [Chloroflexota bacterium]
MKDRFETPLRRIRKARGLSLSELARLAGLTEKSIYNLENERSQPTSRTLRKLAEVLGVAPGELIPPVSIGGNATDAQIIVGCQGVALAKNIKAGRDVAVAPGGRFLSAQPSVGVTPDEPVPSVSIGGDAIDTEMMVGCQDTTLAKNVEAGRDVTITPEGRVSPAPPDAEEQCEAEIVTMGSMVHGTGSGISSIVKTIRKELREVLSEKAEKREGQEDKKEAVNDMKNLPRGDFYDNDLAARLVDEELSRLPQFRLTPDKKRKLVKIIRTHLRTAISSFVDVLEEDG